VILILEQPDDVSLQQLQEIIMHRIPTVPRLRQRLIKLPLDCGRPVWIDDHEFDIDHHLRAVSCPSPGDERALLDTALSVIMSHCRGNVRFGR
jgi:diacylglycerol O-acyltransferase / wax synthase